MIGRLIGEAIIQRSLDAKKTSAAAPSVMVGESLWQACRLAATQKLVLFRRIRPRRSPPAKMERERPGPHKLPGGCGDTLAGSTVA